MRSLDVIMLKNAEAAGREAGEIALTGDDNAHRQMEANNDEAVYEDGRLDKAARSALQTAYHKAFLRELGVRE